MSPSSNQDRRKFFRLKDKASLEYRIIENSAQSPAEFFQLTPQFGLLSEFQTLDLESKHLVRSISDRDRNLGQYLKTLNKKLDSLARVVAMQNQAIDESSIHDIGLSEGGFSIVSDCALEKGTLLALKLVLLPSYTGLLSKGQILSCSALEDDDELYEWHVQFVDMDDHHRQLIARHIIRRQSTARRAEKDTASDEDV